ncbi:GTPase IMAP family member 8-like [Scomber japonicus]|uniref:GTPase IMAP family member 8-like n=1 Tax=Scomber japonicus TaxID=13676 RepID=UPI0023056916|nr:GTPase IMAP family member 8-like [Scomber japonicus]
MCLLVVEDGVSTRDVLEQIDELHKLTEKPREEFIVVPPFKHKPEHFKMFNVCTMEEIFSTLRDLSEKDYKPPQKRCAGKPTTEMEAQTSKSFISGVCDYFKRSSTEKRNGSNENLSDTKVNLVLLGMSGTGKSATGNTILGKTILEKTKFLSEASSMPVTTECQAAETEINGTRVRVIDTPDMFDDEMNSSVRNHHVTQCRQLCQSDPCVYLLVIQVGRFTDGERGILKKVEAAFDLKAEKQKNKKIIILFTCGENLQRKKMSLQVFLQKCHPALSEIVEQCDRRCVVFENKTSRQHQVTELMQTVNRMLNKQQNQ